MGAKLRPAKLVARVSSTVLTSRAGRRAVWGAAVVHVLPELLQEPSVPQPCHREGMGLEKPGRDRAASGAGSPCPHACPSPASSEAKYVFSPGDPCVEQRD